MKQYRIGDYAKYLGVSSDFLKHYEEQGLITPSRSGSGYRYYSFTTTMRLIECVGSGRQRGRTVTEISQELDITLPSVTAMVKRLTAKGYLIKQKAPMDGRQVIIRLTDEGYQAYVGYLFAQRKMINAVRGSIPVEDVGVLLRSLKALNGFFSEKMEELK